MRASSRFGRLIDEILSFRRFAVVGVSRDPQKYGYKVYKALKRAGYQVYAVNPSADDVDGDPVYPYLDNVPSALDCVVTVVPPRVTYDVIHQAGRLGVPTMWMQPGSESLATVNAAQAYGIEAVYGGPCIMVALATRRGALERRG